MLLATLWPRAFLKIALEVFAQSCWEHECLEVILLDFFFWVLFFHMDWFAIVVELCGDLIFPAWKGRQNALNNNNKWRTQIPEGSDEEYSQVPQNDRLQSSYPPHQELENECSLILGRVCHPRCKFKQDLIWFAKAEPTSSIRSQRRPGVAIRTSTPLSSIRRCFWEDIPPTTAATLTCGGGFFVGVSPSFVAGFDDFFTVLSEENSSKWFSNVLRCEETCNANSRVGARTRARRARLVFGEG